MSLLGTPELVFMRETVERSLDGSAVVQHKVQVSDEGGGETTTWSAAGTYACRVAPYNSGAGEQVNAERLSPDSSVVFTFAAETPVDHQDQIVYHGGTFSVTAIRNRSDELSRRVEAKRSE